MTRQRPPVCRHIDVSALVGYASGTRAWPTTAEVAELARQMRAVATRRAAGEVSEVSAMSEMPTFEHQDSQPETSGRRGTWPMGVPPMRLTRPIMKPARHPPPASAEQEPPTAGAAPARGLRVLRALVGIVLIALAWGGFVAVANLGNMALGTLASSRPSAHLLLYLAVALGALWIAAIALCCLIAGAFSLALAITNANFE